MMEEFCFATTIMSLNRPNAQKDNEVNYSYQPIILQHGLTVILAAHYSL